MKAALLDTDVLSAFLRGHPKVLEYAQAYLDEHRVFDLSVITYYEIRNGLLYNPDYAVESLNGGLMSST